MIVLGAKLGKASGFSGARYVLEGEQNRGHHQAKAPLWALAQRQEWTSVLRLSGVAGRELQGNIWCKAPCEKF